MKVFIDILIISNLIITLVFERILSIAMHTKLSRRNKLKSLIPAAISSLLLLVRPENYLESLLITVAKLSAVTLIVKLAFGIAFEKRLVSYTAAYIAVNIAFGGICMFLWEFFGAEFIHIGKKGVYPQSIRARQRSR